MTFTWRSHRFPRRGAETLVIVGVSSALAVIALIAIVLQVFPALAATPGAAPYPPLIITRGLAAANTAVTTYKNDTFRTGQNTNETILNTSNVNSKQFGMRVTYGVDGQVYAQPLFMPNITINGKAHDVVYVATEHDSVYAFDADATSSVAPLWHHSFLSAGVTTAPSVDVYSINCCNVNPEIGITSTPVIDPSTGTIYVLAMTKEAGPTYVQRLHALDITTGQEQPGSPVTIRASVPGTGDGSVNGVVSFAAKHELQRGGLLLMNGVVYISWAGYGDSRPYHGWVMGYNATTLQQTAVLNDTANGNDGGIWQAGSGLAADPSADSIFFQTGNGTYDATTSVFEGGDTIYRVNDQLHLMDSFTPFNQICLANGDQDLGSGGALLLPPQAGAHPSELIGGGKEGRVYVVDRTSMGGFTSTPNPCANQSLTNVDNVVQELHVGTVVGGAFSTPAYWQGPSGAYVYEAGASDHVKAFPVTNGLLATTFSSESPEKLNNPGANVVISSNGTAAGSGIAWALSNPGILYAYDATNLGKELYNSNQNLARDRLPGYMHFTVPTVTNGEVFVGTGAHVVIYGLIPYNNIGISNDSATTSANFDGGGASYSEQALTGVGLAPGKTILSNGVKFVWPNIPAGSPDNYLCTGQTLIDTSQPNATTLAFLGSSSNGPSTGTGTITYTDNTTQTFTLTLSDWTLNGGKSQPSAGNSVVVTMSYRNTPGGKQSRKVDVFYVAVTLAAGKTVASVTLPGTTDKGQLHIFAIGFK